MVQVCIKGVFKLRGCSSMFQLTCKYLPPLGPSSASCNFFFFISASVQTITCVAVALTCTFWRMLSKPQSKLDIEVEDYMNTNTRRWLPLEGWHLYAIFWNLPFVQHFHQNYYSFEKLVPALAQRAGFWPSLPNLWSKLPWFWRNPCQLSHRGPDREIVVELGNLVRSRILCWQ